MHTHLKTILIVDDDAELCATLETALTSHGYRALVATDPSSALDLARAHVPDLIVSDVHFAGADGRDLLQNLFEDEDLSVGPFILMTGFPGLVNQRTIMNLGADDFLQKPFTVDEFLHCIQARLKRWTILRDSEQRVVGELRASLTRSLPHEFLTPLNGILGFADVLRQESFREEEVRSMAEMIYKSGNRLLRTVRNYLTILDLIEGAEWIPKKPEVALPAPEFSKQVEAVAQYLAADYHRERDLVFAGELDSLEEYAIGADGVAVVARELIDNALKFSDPGSRVIVRLRKEDDNLVLMVTDSGRGLSEERLRHIGAFRQFDRSRFAQQGLGLGLTLVQKLLEQQEGKLLIESVPNVGSTVTACWSIDPVPKEQRTS